MKKRKLLVALTTAALVFVMLAATGVMTGCGAKVESIALNTNGVTTEFTVGDEFSASGLKVTAKMSDGSTVDVALKDCKLSNPNMTVAGEKEVTVTYAEKTAKYKITVKEANVKPPIEWKADFTVDPSGSQKKFELSAVLAELDGSDRLGPSDVDPTVSVGGMIRDDKVIFMIEGKAAGKAKLWFDFDHSAHGKSQVKDLIKTTVNGKELVTDAEFNSGAEGHNHPAWMCYQKTLLGEVDIVKGQNTITFTFLGNGSNLKGIILDFGDGEPDEPDPTPELPEKLTGTAYTFEAENADLTGSCSVKDEEAQGANASGGKFVGGFGESSDPDTLTFKINSDKAEKVSLEAVVAFRNPALFSSAFSLKVNGAAVETDPVSLGSGEGWYAWNPLLLANIDLAADRTNTIEFTRTGEATNFDSIVLTAPTAKLTAPGGETPEPEERTYKFEAESALLSKCMVEFKTGVGASGDKLVGDLGTEGAKVTMTVYADAAGTADMKIKYAKNSASVLGNVFDIKVGTTTLDLSAVEVPAGSGSDWYWWTTGTVAGVALAEGANTIEITPKEGVNLDCVELVTTVGLSDKADGAETYRFDGTKATYSEGVGDEPGHEGWLNNIGDGSTVTFTFTSDKDTTGVLSFFMDHNNSQKPMVSQIIDIEVNGAAYSSSAQLGYCGGACPGSWHHAIECKLGVIELKKDQPNTVKFTFKSGEGFSPSNFNGIAVTTEAALTSATA